MGVQQRTEISGSGNIIIQSTGNGATIVVGRPYLEIIPPHLRVPMRAQKTELDLLNPYNRTLDLIGRDADLESLKAWCNSDRPISVRTIKGGAGAGKTRIAIELMNALPAKGDAAWHAGFVRYEELRRFTEHGDLSQWGSTRHTLIAVDYAAISAPALKVLLQHLADHPRGPNDKRLRILLIERDADPKNGWLDAICGGGFSDTNIPELFDPLEPLPLQPLRDTTHRRALLTRMLQAVNQHSTQPHQSSQSSLPHPPHQPHHSHHSHNSHHSHPPALPNPGQDPEFDRRLTADLWDDPLYLMMAALTAHSTGVAHALSLTRTELALQLAKGHELKRIAGFAASGPEAHFLEHMAAYTTLCGGLAPEHALPAFREESEALGIAYAAGPGTAVEHLRTALPATDGGIAPVIPDIIGEALVLAVLRPRPSVEQRATVTRAVQRLGKSALSTLVRLIQDYFPGGAQEPLEWIEHLIREGSAGDTMILVQIESVLPQQTLALREKAAEVTQLLLDMISAAEANAPSETLRSEKARLTSNLAACLSELGHCEEALEKGEEALRLYRELASAYPDLFLPDLAMSVNNLAVMLRGLGRREEALAHAEEAVRVRRELATARPDAFLPDLAMSVNNLAAILSNLGRREEALAHAEEAVRIRRELAAAHPDAFLPGLAMSLNNLANGLSDLGRREEALAHAEEAVRIRRKLATARPDAFLPDLATSLGALSQILAASGRHAEAAQNTLEALVAMHPLLQRYPQAHAPLVAALAGEYISACKASGAEPDLATLDRYLRY